MILMLKAEVVEVSRAKSLYPKKEEWVESVAEVQDETKRVRGSLTVRQEMRIGDMLNVVVDTGNLALTIKTHPPAYDSAAQAAYTNYASDGTFSDGTSVVEPEVTAPADDSEL